MQGIGNATQVIEQEQLIEFVVNASVIKTVQIINFQLEHEAYYSLNVYRIEEKIVNETQPDLSLKEVNVTTEVPISVLSKEVLIATYNPSYRELEYATTQEIPTDLSTLDMTRTNDITPVFYYEPAPGHYGNYSNNSSQLKEQVDNNNITIMSRHFWNNQT